MTRVLLIHAGPTPWDEEDRVSGNHPLPLTELGHQKVQHIIAEIAHPVTGIYRHKKNDACNEVAALLTEKFKIKPRDSALLDEMNLGLWQGLTRSDLKFRYPKVVEQWKDNPLAVQPPEGETVPQAIERLGDGLKRILRRNRGITIALPLRPIAMQIMLGLLRHEPPLTIASHLQQSSPVETIELSHEDVQRFIL
jgi:broad specificity phosphatase PhoE